MFNIFLILAEELFCIFDDAIEIVGDFYSGNGLALNSHAFKCVNLPGGKLELERFQRDPRAGLEERESVAAASYYFHVPPLVILVDVRLLRLITQIRPRDDQCFVGRDCPVSGFHEQVPADSGDNEHSNNEEYRK